MAPAPAAQRAASLAAVLGLHFNINLFIACDHASFGCVLLPSVCSQLAATLPTVSVRLA